MATKKTARHDELDRRQTLRLLGAAGVSVLGACSKSGRASPDTGAGGSGGAGADQSMDVAAGGPDAGSLSCVVRPEQIEGPFFVDEQLDRSDIRSDPTDGTVTPGVPLRIVLRVARITGAGCQALPGVIVDVWQCDALGVYSDALSPGLFDTRGKKFLRGLQTSDASGRVEFIAVYPGWYPGRAVHGHFKLRGTVAGASFTFTSQYYFTDAVTDTVHGQAPYATKPGVRTTNAGDSFFLDRGDQLILTVTKDVEGYLGSLDIGLALG